MGKTKSWDDTDSDEEEDLGNVALMTFEEPLTPPNHIGGLPVASNYPKFLCK